MTLQSISKRLTKAATIMTIIPVAKVRFGFSAGFDESDFGDSGDSEHPVTGIGGGGGRVEVRPIGFVEITPGKTRFVPIGEGPKTARLVFTGLVVGFILLMRRHRKKHHADSE